MPPEEEPEEMPLPSDPKVIFLGGLFALAVLTALYVAAEIVLPLVLAVVALTVKTTVPITCTPPFAEILSSVVSERTCFRSDRTAAFEEGACQAGG